MVRYLEGASWRGTAARLGLAEDAAQKRGTRAVDKMRRFVHRHGLTLSLAALTALLSDEAAQAASLPAALLDKINGPPSPHVSTLYQGVTHVMTLTKIIAVSASLTVAATFGGLLWARSAHTPFRPFHLQAAAPLARCRNPTGITRTGSRSLQGAYFVFYLSDSSGQFHSRPWRHRAAAPVASGRTIRSASHHTRQRAVA